VSRFTLSLALLGALALSACAVQPPSAPSVVGLPAAGKDLSQFREDDASCRGYAAQQIAGVTETGYNLQVRYDIAYTQCMYSKGDTVRPLTQVSGYALASYIALNAQFHSLLVDLARSPMVRRAIDRAVALPFASPNAFLMGHAQKKEGREVVRISQMHHRAIVEAIANREPARAESMAREHSRLARTSLEMILRDRQLLLKIPGASLIRFPDLAS